MAERSGLAIETIRGPDHTRFWQTVSDFPLPIDRLVYRVIVPSGSAIDFIQTVLSGPDADGGAEIVGDVAMAVLYISLEANDRAARWFAKLSAEARRYRGHAVMLAAPLDLKQNVDVWGSAPAALSLMREIKRQFDPKELLNPGRMVGGI
jgi:glycolate oxidase FAD binding subunit